MDALGVRYNQLDGAITAYRAVAGETEVGEAEEAALTEAAAYNELGRRFEYGGHFNAPCRF